MPPVHRRGANKVKDKSQLGPGDLVLAKVRGFPPWPAKISIPEYWKRSPDPKKYSVEFFGTQEIGFVAPEDIQAFTDEVKSKLSARCQRKTAKCFAQAVKEICLAFDELNKNKSIGSVEDTGRSDVGDGASSVNGGEDDGVQFGLKQDQVVISDLMRARLPVSIKQPSFVDPEDVTEVEKEGEHLTKDEGQDYSWATSCSQNSRLVLSQNMPTFRDDWKCGYCATDKTPVRRMRPMGPKTLCGACGLQYLRQWELEQQQQREQQRFQLQLQYHQQQLQLQLQHQQEIQFQRQSMSLCSSGSCCSGCSSSCSGGSSSSHSVGSSSRFGSSSSFFWNCTNGGSGGRGSSSSFGSSSCFFWNGMFVRGVSNGFDKKPCASYEI